MTRVNPIKINSGAGERLKHLRKALELKAEDMAVRLEISRGYLSELENNKTDISAKVISALAREYFVNEDYLRGTSKSLFLMSKGKQVDLSGLASVAYVSDVGRSYLGLDAKPIGVPLFDLGVSAGSSIAGQTAVHGKTESTQIFFTESYMRRNFGRAGDGFAMVYVQGDSMQPALYDGDEIVVDTRVNRVDRDGVYVFTLRGDIKVKRIQAKIDGSLLIKSDNKAYDNEIVNADDVDQFQIQGRLVWPRLR